MIQCIGLICACVLSPVPQDVEEAAPPKPLFAHDGVITNLVLGPKRKILYTATNKMKIHAWDLRKGRFLWHGEAHLPISMSGLAIGKKKVFYSGRFAAYTTADIETGKGKRGARGGPTALDVCTGLVVDPNGRWVWLGTATGFVTRLTPRNTDAWIKRSMENGGVTCLAQNASANLLAVGGKDASVRFIKIANAKLDEKKIFEGRSSPVVALAFDRKGTSLSTGASDGTIRVWSVSGGKIRFELKGHDKAIGGLVFDPRGKFLASGDADGVVKLWDAKTGKELTTLSGTGTDAVADLVFLSNGKKLAVASGKRVHVLDLSSH